MVTRWLLDVAFNFWQVGDFWPLQNARTGCWCAPNFLFKVCSMSFTWGGVWWQGCEGDCLGQFSAKVNNEWHCTSAAMIYLHVLHNYYTVAYRSIQHFSGTAFYFHTNIVHLFALGNVCLVYWACITRFDTIWLFCSLKNSFQHMKSLTQVAGYRDIVHIKKI
jgi:hypothetical protein